MYFEVLADAVLAAITAVCIAVFLWRVFERFVLAAALGETKFFVVLTATENSSNISEAVRTIQRCGKAVDIIVADCGMADGERECLARCSGEYTLLSINELEEYISDNMRFHNG